MTSWIRNVHEPAACTGGQEWYPEGHKEKHCPQVMEGDAAPLLSPSKISSGVLCLVLDSSGKGDVFPRVSSVEGD